MDEVFELNHRVGYFQVDQGNRIHLSSLFKLLQEAAIHHATLGRIGTQVMEENGESWILNRVAMKLDRYPQFDEALTIKTWATRMKHFKGFRDFKILAGEALIGQVSTLWLYIDLDKKTIARLPNEAVEHFPTRPHDLYFDDLDRLRLPKPGSNAKETTVTLRYSDIDGNQHVNNAAYMDFLQTALHHQHLDARPKELLIQFAQEISPAVDTISVQLESSEDAFQFGIGTSGESAAFGRLRP